MESNYYNNLFGWNSKAGTNHLDGERTLIHARNRKSNGGDFERTRRQRDIIFAILNKLSGEKDINKLFSMLNFFNNHVKTNISVNKLFSLAVTCINNKDLTINQGRVPADKTWKYSNKGGRSVIVINFEKNKEMLYNMLYEEEPSP